MTTEANHEGRMRTIGLKEDFSPEVTELPTVSARQVAELRKRRILQGENNEKMYGTVGLVEFHPEDALHLYTSDRYQPISTAARDFLVPAAKNFENYSEVRAFVVSEPFKTVVNKEERGKDIRWYIKNAKMLNSLILSFPSLDDTVYVYRGVSDLYVADYLRDSQTKEIKTEEVAIYIRGQKIVMGNKPLYSERKPLSYYESQLDVGAVLPFYGFISTSLSPNISVTTKIFGASRAKYAPTELPPLTDSTQCCFFQFKLPPGYPYQFTDLKGEYEMILPYALKDGSIPLFEVYGKKKIRFLYHSDEFRLNCLDSNCLKKGLEKEGKEKPRFIDLNLIQLRPVNS